MTSSQRVLLRGGTILTGDDRADGPTHDLAHQDGSEPRFGPTSTAMALEGRVISWIGDEEHADGYADGAEEVIDLAGGLVTPAFVDAHVHTSQTGLRLGGLDLAAATSAHDLLDRLARYARGYPDAVILGFGWDETRWTDPRLPSAAEIDRAAPGRPVYLSRVDVHSGLVSGALYERAPAMATRPGWDGTGRVEREAHHVARDAASALVTRAQRRTAIAVAFAAAAANGIASVHEMAAPHVNPADDLALMTEIAAERPVVEVVPYWGELATTGGVERARALGARGAAGDLCADGAFGSRTAALTAHYVDRPGHAGRTYLDAEDVAEHVLACTRAGLQAGFHCIGDAATAAVVDGFRRAEKRLGADRLTAARHRLEHVELIAPEDVADLARWGVVVSGQPAFDAAWGGVDGMYATRLGVERALAANPWATMRRAGVRLAFGSDTPVTPFDPWGGVRAAVWHHNADERISVADAFAAHTGGGRWAALDDHDGVLRPGAEATYAVWDLVGSALSGLPSLAPGTPSPTCVRTVAGGRILFDRDDDRHNDREHT